MDQRAADLAAELRLVTADRDRLAGERKALLIETDRLREDVVALQMRLTALESAGGPRMRGLASLITPPDLRASG
ncbi:MAG: hypothetical protein ABIO67_05770 [Mycobacteriales bacterium]